MKKIIILIISLIFIISFYSCTLYSGIAYSEQENVFYLTKQNGSIYKCKLINKKLHCVEIEFNDVD